MVRTEGIMIIECVDFICQEVRPTLREGCCPLETERNKEKYSQPLTQEKSN